MHRYAMLWVCLLVSLVLPAAAQAQSQVTNYIIQTTHRTINVEQEWPGAAAQHGGLVYPYLATSNARCQSVGWSTMIVTFADGEGWCANNGERIVSVQPVYSTSCPTYIIQTTHRTINVEQEWPGAAAQHGGLVYPYLATSNARCQSVGWSTMIVTFADGEGWCAYNGERIVSVQSSTVACR